RAAAGRLKPHRLCRVGERRRAGAQGAEEDEKNKLARCAAACRRVCSASFRVCRCSRCQTRPRSPLSCIDAERLRHQARPGNWSAPRHIAAAPAAARSVAMKMPVMVVEIAVAAEAEAQAEAGVVVARIIAVGLRI